MPIIREGGEACNQGREAEVPTYQNLKKHRFFKIKQDRNRVTITNII
jgi:hypothetical protein